MGGRDAKDVRLPLGPNSFIFMQLSAKILPNDRVLPQIGGVDVPGLGNP